MVVGGDADHPAVGEFCAAGAATFEECEGVSPLDDKHSGYTFTLMY